MKLSMLRSRIFVEDNPVVAAAIDKKKSSEKKTQNQIGKEAADYSKAMTSLVKSGKRTPSLEKAAELSKALNIKPEKLIGKNQ